MGKEDINLKNYFNDAGRYADLWNGGVFEGKQIVKPDELQEVHPSVFKADNHAVMERSRDAVMKQTLTGQRFILLAVENQKIIDYSMPVRIMLEEALTYDQQRKEIVREKKRAENDGVQELYKNAGELLYKFRRKDKLQPVVTLVAYWGEELWDGPVNLHDMIDFGSELGQGNCLKNAEIQKLIPEYPLHFIDMSQIEHPEYFKTELRPFLELYQRRNDKTEFVEYIRNNENAQKMDDESWYMLGQVTHSEELMKAIALKNDKCEESEAMCKALEDFYNDGVEEGKSIGKEEGRTEGKAEGKAEIVASVRKMHLRGFGAEEIADLLDQGQRIIEQILNLITDNPEADNLQIAKKLLEKEGVA